jgi:hypothetical protein
MAIVDIGAKVSYVSLACCPKHGLLVQPNATPNSTISRAGLPEPEQGTQIDTLANGSTVLCKTILTVLPEINYDVILCLNIHQQLGIRLVGVPVKMPGPEIVELDNVIPTDCEQGNTPAPITPQPFTRCSSKDCCY